MKNSTSTIKELALIALTFITLCCGIFSILLS